MPDPNKGETQDDWMHRCMSDDEQKKTFPDEKQRVAVCISKWERRKKESAPVPAMPTSPAWLRASAVASRPVKVDRAAGVIHGYTLAQTGPFKSGRGEFNGEGLKQIAAMINDQPNGVKSRFTHPSLSGDGLGKFLGRSMDARVEGDKVKGDLHLSPTSRNTPHGDLGGYVMDLAEADPGAFSSSLVLKPREEYRTDSKGRYLVGPGGEELPPLWFPESIHASDVVDEGDAVHDGFLAAPPEVVAMLLRGDLPDDFVRAGSALLDAVFAGQARGVVEARVTAWLGRYLELRYGPAQPTPRLDARLSRLQGLALVALGANLTHDSKTADSEPEWGSVDKGKLPRVAFAEKGEADKKSTWGFPHHWVSGGSVDADSGVYTSGTLYLHKGGLNAAWSAAQGGRSGQKADAAVIAHLQAHRRALGLDKED